MAKKASPRRYARAVFEIALDKKELDRWQADLGQMSLAAGEGSFTDVLGSPKIAPEDKARFLKEVLGDISPLAMNLARLLIARSGISLVREIAAEYKRMLDKYRGIAAADVVTAMPLDDNDKERIRTQLGVMTAAEIELKTVVDPGILGGIIARVDGRLLDGSTRSKLAALKRELEGGR